MTIVPKQTDALNALIELSGRTSSLERGCSDGPATEATPAPATPDDPNSAGDVGAVDPATGEALPPDPGAKADVKLEIIPRGIATTRKSGKDAYPHGGLYPLYGAKKKNYLAGKGVDPATNRADTVTIFARVKTRAVRKVESGAWSTLFHLPPGWWPTTAVSGQALTALRGVGSSGPIPVRVTTDGHVQARGPFHHPQTAPGGPGPAIRALDLRGLSFPGGGGSCPGVPTNDPTAAGDGRSWDFCEGGGDSGIPEADPALEPGAAGGGGGPKGTAYFALTGNVPVGGFRALPWGAYHSLPGDVNDAIGITLLPAFTNGGAAFKIDEDGFFLVEYQLVYSPDSPTQGVVAEVGLAAPQFGANADAPYYGEDDRIEDSGVGYGSRRVTFSRHLKKNSIFTPYCRGGSGIVIGASGGNNFGGSHLQITRL